MTIGTAQQTFVVNDISLGRRLFDVAAESTEESGVPHGSYALDLGFYISNSYILPHSWAEWVQRSREIPTSLTLYDMDVHTYVPITNSVLCLPFETTAIEPRAEPLARSAQVIPFGGRTAKARLSERERLLADLGRLQDGWAGPGTVAPSSETFRDVQLALNALDRRARSPSIEVDTEDGATTLCWQTDGEAFSLIASGNGTITGVLSPYRPEYAPWTLPAGESEKIARKLFNPTVQKLLSNT